MSAIYGYINFDGRPVEPEILQNMKQAMAFCGPDGSSSWMEGNCGMGQMMLFNTPESVNEKYPLIDASGNIVFMAACRIDNRVELFNLLDIPNELKNSITDGELMFQSYLKWGENACDKLLGDWSFAAWHKKEQKFFLARDHHGPTALYYYKDNNRFVYATSLKAILKIPGIEKKANPYWLTKFALSINDRGEETIIEKVFYLANAYHLTLENKSLRSFRYWMLENTPKIHYHSDSSIAEAFREIYFRAIQDRTRSHKLFGATLSGGLDSNSVCSYLSKFIGSNQKLNVFSAIPGFSVPDELMEKYTTDESDLIKLGVNYYRNTWVNWLKSENTTLTSCISRFLNYSSEPIYGASNSTWINNMFKTAKDLNIGTMFNPQGGNFAISFPSDSLYTAYEDTFRNNLKTTFRNIFRKETAINYDSADILSEGVNLCRSFSVFKDQLFINPFKKLDEKNFRNYLKLLAYLKAGVQVSQFSLSYDIETRDPGLDKRVLSFFAAVPVKKYFQSYPRFLIRNSFENSIPSSILYNNKPGIQSADISARIKNEINSINSAIESFAACHLVSDTINVNFLNKSLNNVLENRSNFGSSIIFTRDYMLTEYLFNLSK
jgi:asparagine synthase (glutamine-hydrolysing)